MPQPHFEDVFQLLPTPSLLLLPDAPKFTIVAVNKAYLETMISIEEDLLGKGIFEAFPDNPKDLISKGSSNLMKSLEQVVSKKESHKIPLQKYNMLLPGISKFKVRYFNIQNIPLKDDGKINYILHSVEDVTDKKNLEIALETERLRFSDLYLQAPSCMGILKGADHVYEMANLTYLQLINRKNIIGKSFKEIRPESAEQGFIKILNQVYKTGKTFSAKEKLVKLNKEANGNIVDMYMDMLLQPYKDNNGKTDGIFFFLIDVTEKVESRKKIEESEKRYRELIENLPVATYSCDAEGKILVYNKAAVALWGQEPEIEKVLWCGAWKIYDEDGNPIPFDKCPMSIALKEGRKMNDGKIIIERPNGELANILAYSVPFSDSSGRVTGAVNVLIDITNRKKEEEKLGNLNKELSDYKYALDESSIVAITDQKGTIKHVNDNFCKISQYSREELIGQNHRMINSGYHSKEYFQNMWNTISKGKIWKGEVKNKAKDGSIYWVDTIITPLLDEEKKPYQYVATRFDITESKKAEENIKKQNVELVIQYQEKKIRATELFNAIKELAYQNGEKEKRADELILANLELDFQNGEKENRAAELFIANNELAYQNGEKEKRADELILANLELKFQNEEKENRATELSISNKELVKTNTELDRFVYSVSHDLRSPLTSILGLISLIEEDSREPETLEQVKMIRESINRLDGFIKNIMSYSQNNRTGLETVKIPIEKTINEIVNSVRNIKEAKGILFQIGIDEQQPFYSDWQRFNTIMENLISNAIKYHTNEATGRYLNVTGTADSEGLKLSISDNGIGIDAPYHDKIFDMFYRLSSKTSGSGFGLYIVKETLEKMQGNIEVQSEKGVGSTFIITLKNLRE